MSKGKLLAVCVIWLIIIAIGAVAWRFVVTPMANATKAEQEQQRQAEEERERERIRQATGGRLWYEHEVAIALDSFPGYAVLRSDKFDQLLRDAKIKLKLIDDAANYTERLNNLRDGKVQMAAFTVDALIKTTAIAGDSEPQATIVALIDETRGADAMVAYKSVVNNVDDLNHPDARFVLIPDSPSETLARLVMNTFALDQVPADPFDRAEDPDDIFRRYKSSPKNSRQVFVVWEPYVSKILANDSMHVVIDSSRFTGYIVDCLVAERDFLSKNPELVKTIVECYFSALYQYRDDERMAKLVQADDTLDPPMDAASIKKVVEESIGRTHRRTFPTSGCEMIEALNILRT